MPAVGRTVGFEAAGRGFKSLRGRHFGTNLRAPNPNADCVTRLRSHLRPTSSYREGAAV